MRLLDLYCGAGGAAMGYYRAGFTDIVGVDNKPQPRYPFEFTQSDALEYLERHGTEFDVIHASPPCQAYSTSSKQWRLSGRSYADLIEPTRILLKDIGRPYVIENVGGSPLIDPVLLVGTMFGLLVNRPRYFECSFPVDFILQPAPIGQAKMGRPPRFDGDFIQPVGHFSGVEYASDAMGIDWMGQKELAQAIPPAYTEWIGKQLLKAIRDEPEE